MDTGTRRLRVQLKPILQHTITWSAATRPPLSLCYRPAVFFHHIRLIALACPKGNFRGAFQRWFQFKFFTSLKPAYIWNFLILNFVHREEPPLPPFAINLTVILLLLINLCNKIGWPFQTSMNLLACNFKGCISLCPTYFEVLSLALGFQTAWRLILYISHTIDKYMR